MSRFLPSRLLVSILLLACCVVMPPAFAAEPAKKAGEYEVKAVFLYNFARFVEWPETAFTNSEAPFVIVVAGEDPFGQALDDAVAGEQVRNRRLIVKRIRSSDPIPDCHLLFISRSEKDRLAEISRGLRRQPTLIVADTPRGAERGAMVNLVVQDSVRMEINQLAAEAAGLHISSKLLGLAKIVESEPRLESWKELP
jgi:hypothetical protein